MVVSMIKLSFKNKKPLNFQFILKSLNEIKDQLLMKSFFSHQFFSRCSTFFRRLAQTLSQGPARLSRSEANAATQGGTRGGAWPGLNRQPRFF